MFSSDSRFLPEGIVPSEVASHVIKVGKDRAARWAKVYGNLDNLRPYFDVDPRTLLNRMLYSFIPVTDLTSPEKGTRPAGSKYTAVRLVGRPFSGTKSTASMSHNL